MAMRAKRATDAHKVVRWARLACFLPSCAVAPKCVFALVFALKTGPSRASLQCAAPCPGPHAGQRGQDWRYEIQDRARTVSPVCRVYQCTGAGPADSCAAYTTALLSVLSAVIRSCCQSVPSMRYAWLSWSPRSRKTFTGNGREVISLHLGHAHHDTQVLGALVYFISSTHCR